MYPIDKETALNWAHQLGLAASPLFGIDAGQPAGEHFALLDGRRGSFAYSLVEQSDISPEDSRNWQWSADLAHHVVVTPDEVRVQSGSERPRRFDRSSVEHQLRTFLTFLEESRHIGLPDIVPFLIDEFLQLWSVVPGERPTGAVALATFLVALEAAGEEDPAVFDDRSWRLAKGVELGFEDETASLLETLDERVIARATKIHARTPRGLQIVPSLVLRHTAGRLFQEAHAYLEAAQMGLFDDNLITTVPTHSPTGAYFTPLALARLVAESALRRWDVLPDELTLADFACGSGVFLTEGLRELERRGYGGTVRVIGRDISPEAITMARVSVSTTKRDLIGMRVIPDITRADAFQLEVWPQADVILMNPPFRSWEQMGAPEREWVRRALGGTSGGRPDLSVGFVERALSALNPSGVLATLLPAGVLSSEGLGAWRSSLLERITPRLIAVLGEHGLFRHATVNVGVLVLQRKPAEATSDHHLIDVAWAAPEPGAASEAIRAIRRRLESPAMNNVREGEDSAWTVTESSVGAWSDRQSWLPGPGALGPLLDQLQQIPTRVEDLFHVHQGIRTGANEIFLVTESELNKLGKEKRFFRPVVDTASFVEGELHPQMFLFVHDPEWQSEDDLERAVPTFFRERLSVSANRRVLSARKGIRRWWELTRVRGWSFDGRARLVSKRFGLYPAFARDFSGNLAVVQANAWVPKDPLVRADSERIYETLTAYWWLLNSRVAVALFKEYCPNVAGGQLDLENKYVRHVPLPNLALRAQEDPGVQELATQIRQRNGEKLPSLGERDVYAAAVFGTQVADWPLSISR
jgi:hypothetical protein